MADNFNPFGPGYPFIPQYYAVDEQGQRLIPPANYMRGAPQFSPQRPELIHTNFLGHDDQSRTMLPAQGSARVRRRVGASGEQVKFRRTRSGCFTCRNRRVKCDETRPICDRCRKGSRDCIYPEQSSSTKVRRGSSKGKADEGDASSQEEDDDTPENALPADDEDVEPNEPASASSLKSLGSPLTELSDPPSLTHDKSPTPSTEGSASIDAIPSGWRPALRSQSLRQPPGNSDRLYIKYYLEYARNKLTPHHWGFKFPYESAFLRNTLFERAVKFKPLLYAVVGFASYHHTLTMRDGKISDFLYYYNKSVSLLRESLKKEQHTIETLLTILQLGTIEEYLGSWVNCMSHQMAAYQILSNLYSPQEVVRNDDLRIILQWYIHFDVFAGMLSGNGTILPREWFEVCHEWDLQQIKLKPEDVELKYRECCSRCRLLAADVALMFARKSRNEITEEDFNAKCKAMDKELRSWESNLDPILRDSSKLITNFPDAPPQDPEDIVDPYQPNTIFDGELFGTNFIILQFLGLDLMFQYQLSAAQGETRLLEMQQLALRMCQLVEAIQHHRTTPESVLLGIQASLAMATTFLPRDEKHNMWSRRKLATVEALGYVYPTAFRTRMGQFWEVDVSDWWLPNEEGRPQIIRQIREWTDVRVTSPRGTKEEDLLEMRGVFSTLSLSGSSSPESYHDLSQRSATGLRRTASDPAPTGRQPELDIISFESVTNSTGIEQNPMIYDNSPEFTWGYEQKSWDGF